MLEAVVAARGGLPSREWLDSAIVPIRQTLEAALLWQRDNAPVPSVEQMRSIRADVSFTMGDHRMLCAEWIKRMYDAPDPKVPDEIKDLLDAPVQNTFLDTVTTNAKIIEAFRRGQESK
jgi:hypothetical protein